MENSEVVKKKNKSLYKIVFVLITIIVVGLLFFLFRNIIFEVIRYTKADDQEGLKEFMRSTGWLGYIAIVLIEALEMVVIFIPAEFIQIPAGLSFPFIISVLLCDLGVCLGASIIYFLVHVLKFDNEFIRKKQKRINSIANKKKGQNTQILMYFLFVTPIIPFGAICYFASSKKISYRRYILTCATGVIPSIVTSIIMGTSIKYFISENLPLWALVVIIFSLGAILFIGMFFISRKYLFNGRKIRNTPYSFLSPVISFVFGIYTKLTAKIKVIENDLYEEMGALEGPKVYLANHLSANDLYCCYITTDPDRSALVSNRYYMRFKSTRWCLKKLGFVPKTLFNPDLDAVKRIIGYVKNDTSILMFPEGRLSLDGTTNKITLGTGTLLKKLGANIVILNISGNYFASSKVRRSHNRVPVEVEVKKIIKNNELENISNLELDTIISKTLAHNEFEFAKKHIYKDKNKAENLDSVLYLCPHCHQEFKMHANGNTLECECGFKLEIDEHFAFNENEYNLHNIH